ncbi:hypothetical protein F66182_5675 [Fusarium sp. NRRL 66182]|nr:hypothetical protein F66182_5675 [Fusarium sp. NRRL 66182]
MAYFAEKDIDKAAKGWSIAMKYSKERLRRVHNLKDDQLEDAVNDGHLVLETVCLFVHACVRPGQFQLPLEFWRILHSEYGIIVYPSAFVEVLDVSGLGTDVTFTEAYHGHIMMCGGTKNPPRCPFEFMTEPPPVYQKEAPRISS